ncbi:MAG: DNA mismatch repair protein MutL [Elusimicrobia bacterium]|nr:DNA mismatch repair protein MutL [Elusimicrobiota bacterium]
MSPRVHQLPEDLVARIAAGEVVERPASIIKELVENSLDAGADHITVAIEGAGRSRILIVDNGCGMTKEDALLALRRHATSKISRLEDLEAIQTFGFRGEALPSIAAVSRLTLTTRSEEEEMGWELSLEGGKLVSEKRVAREPGTTLEVRDVFFNTPARFKFLKSDATERAQCLRVLEEMIFSSLGVTFELRNEKGKPVIFRATKVSQPEDQPKSVKTRLTEAWGARWSQNLLPVFHQTEHFKLSGVVTRQEGHQATSRYQFLYINRRPVQNRRLSRAVYDAYRGGLPSLRHPGWALFLDVNPSTVDVNVHPSKREVKLTHESELYGFLNNAIKMALSGGVSSPSKVQVGDFGRASDFVSYQQGSSRTSFSPPRSMEAAARQLYTPLDAPSSPSQTPVFPTLTPSNEERPELTDLRDPELVILGQIKKTYLVAQTRNGLLLVDQHAAAEQAAYERLLFNIKSAKRPVQMLLVPFTWEVALSLVPLVEKNLDLLSKMGFMIEPFGGSTFVVKGIPAHLNNKLDLHSLLDGLSDEFHSNHRAADLDHRLAAMTACKASIKAGDPLDLPAGLAIIRQLALCESPFTCPHGRPTVLRFPYSELDRRFRRS